MKKQNTNQSPSTKQDAKTPSSELTNSEKCKSSVSPDKRRDFNQTKDFQEEIFKELREKFNGNVRAYLLSKGDFKDVLIYDENTNQSPLEKRKDVNDNQVCETSPEDNNQKEWRVNALKELIKFEEESKRGARVELNYLNLLKNKLEWYNEGLMMGKLQERERIIELISNWKRKSIISYDSDCPYCQRHAGNVIICTKELIKSLEENGK